jgi:glycine reductase complex component B subunit gamma
MLRVGHYLNQFFAGVGAEEHANHAPEQREGAVGPGRALQTLLKDEGRVVSTLVCGDNFFNERVEQAHAAVRGWLGTVRPDVVVAGPAFAAGRYGSACAQVCRLAAEAGIPAVTGMHPENPGVLLYPRAYVVPTGNSAAEMGRALAALLPILRKLATGRALGPASAEGYLPRGVRRPAMREATGADRAVSMLVDKLAGRPFQSEIPVDAYDAVPPAPPVRDLRGATIALVTSGAIVPRGNPDRFKRCSDTKWARYSLKGLDALSAEAFECVHGGFYNQMASDNPNLVLPLDVVRELEREGAFGRLVDFYCSTTGNDQRLLDCRRNGAEIAAALVTERADGVLLVCT